MGAGFTRQRFLKALGVGAAYLALAGARGCAPRVWWPLPSDSPKAQKGVWVFRSRPDLAPAAAELTTRARDTAPGYIFLAIKEGAGEHGPMILDDNGQMVWFGKHPQARDFKLQYYRGRAVLTWWEGAVVEGHGEGEYVIFDDSYREVRRVRSGSGYHGDLHEFLITPENTALLTAYTPRQRTCPRSVDRKTGDVLWRLDGKKSDFEMGQRTRSAFQHDARRQEDGTITIFDNGAHPKVHDQSRAIDIGLDEDAMKATLLREYASPDRILATSQGNAQLLPDGNVFVGWGSAPFVSEFSHDGELLMNARFPPECESYRAFRFPWSGYPTGAPAVAIEHRGEGK